MSEADATDSESDQDPIEVAIDRLEDLDGELRAMADGTIDDCKHFLWEDHQDIAAEVHTLIDRQEELEAEKGLREQVRDSVSSLRRLTGGEQPPSRLETAAAVLEFQEHVIDHHLLLDGVAASHKSVVNGASNLVGDLDGVWDADLDTLEDMTRYARATAHAMDYIEDDRADLQDEFADLHEAYDHLDLELGSSIDAYMVLPETKFEQFHALVSIISDVLVGLVAVRNGRDYFDDEAWEAAEEHFSTGYQHFRTARQRYEDVRTLSDETPVGAVLEQEFSRDLEESVLEYADAAIETVRKFESAAITAQRGREINARNAFSIARDRIAEKEFNL